MTSSHLLIIFDRDRPHSIVHCTITINNFDVVGISSFAYLRANTPRLLCEELILAIHGTPGSRLKIAIIIIAVDFDQFSLY